MRTIAGSPVADHLRTMCAWLSLLAVGAGLGCQGSSLSDEELTRTFVAHEGWFDQIASKYAAGHVVCRDARDPDICAVPDAQPAMSHLQGDAHVQSVYVKRNHAGDDGVWLPVQTYGLLSTLSYTRGYVYLDRPPAAMVADTFGIYTKGSHYKHLKDRWYLFTAN
jgi:hypothetical protein